MKLQTTFNRGTLEYRDRRFYAYEYVVYVDDDIVEDLLADMPDVVSLPEGEPEGQTDKLTPS